MNGVPRNRNVMRLFGGLVGLLLLAGVCLWILPRSAASRAHRVAVGFVASQELTGQPTTTQPITKDAQGRLLWHRPRNAERQHERNRMVGEIIRRDPFRRAVSNKNVIAALRGVPRHEFVPPDRRGSAYADSPLPIGHGQTISQPYIVALMTDLLKLKPGDKVLEIGTGSGYQAAVLSELTPYVFSIEIVKPLHRQATERFKTLGYATVRTRQADGYDGWAEHAPFDAIIVTCAAGHVPPPLWKQLERGGRMVIPLGGVHDVQRLLLLTKLENGRRKSESILPVRFVPMTGKSQRP